MSPRQQASPVTRVMVVDDQALLRAAVKQALAVPDIEVVAEASAAEEALLRATELRPDVLLVDLDLPGLGGLELVRALAPRLPRTKIVVLAASGSPSDALDAVRFGATGYLTTDLSPEALLRSVRGVRDGDLAMPRRIAAGVVAQLVRRHGVVGADEQTPLSRLTFRESEILDLVADGLTDRDVAETLRISVRTVETHVSNLLRKLGARNRAEAARMHRERS